MSKAPYLIIGNSAAAVGCITGIRSEDHETPIILLAKENEHTYSRPLITYLLGGKVTEDQMYYRPLDYYQKSGVSARLGVEVKKLDAEAKKVITASGEEIAFEKCLIATGGTPFTPPGIKGVKSQGVFTFTTWQDARAIKSYVEANGVTHAVVVGGGLIGLKSVEALTLLGVKVTVVELAERILSITLDQTASDLAAQALRDNGVELITGTTISSIQAKQGKVSGVTLKNQEKRPCGLVIMAIGVLPQTSLVSPKQVKLDRGILVDEHCMSSAQDIYAAGDVAQAAEILSGQRLSIPIWPNAFRQGYIAGINMAGGQASYEGGLAMNAVEICGLPTVSAGLTTVSGGGYEVMEQMDELKGIYRKVVLKDDVVVGYVMVGDIERAGIFTGLIKGKVNVGDRKNSLLEKEFGLITLPKHYRVPVQAGRGVVTA